MKLLACSIDAGKPIVTTQFPWGPNFCRLAKARLATLVRRKPRPRQDTSYSHSFGDRVAPRHRDPADFEALVSTRLDFGFDEVRWDCGVVKLKQ